MDFRKFANSPPDAASRVSPLSPPDHRDHWREIILYYGGHHAHEPHWSKPDGSIEQPPKRVRDLSQSQYCEEPVQYCEDGEESQYYEEDEEESREYDEEDDDDQDCEDEEEFDEANAQEGVEIEEHNDHDETKPQGTKDDRDISNKTKPKKGGTENK